MASIPISMNAPHGGVFIEQDGRRDPEAAQALAAIGIFATPLLVVEKEKALGHRPESLAAAPALVSQEA